MDKPTITIPLRIAEDVRNILVMLQWVPKKRKSVERELDISADAIDDVLEILGPAIEAATLKART